MPWVKCYKDARSTKEKEEEGQVRRSLVRRRRGRQEERRLEREGKEEEMGRGDRRRWMGWPFCLVGMPLFSQPILRALSIPGKVLQRAGSSTRCSSTSRSSSAFRVQCEVSGQHLRAGSVCFPVVTDEVNNPEGLKVSNSRPRMESILSTVQNAFRHRGH